MKINANLKMRKIAGEYIVLLQTESTLDMTRVLALNESSHLLWESLIGKDFEIEDVVNVLLDNYEVEEAVARADALKWVDQLKEFNVIE